MNNQQTCLLYIVCLFVEKISKYLIPQLLETFRQVGEKGKQFLKKYFMDGTGYHLIVMMTIDDNGDDRSNGQAKSFVLGQKLEDKQVEALASLPSNASFLQKLLVKHRRLIGGIKIIAVINALWQSFNESCNIRNFQLFTNFGRKYHFHFLLYIP